MKLRLIMALLCACTIALTGFSPAGAAPPGHAKAPDYVRDKHAAKDQGQDREINNEQEMENGSPDSEGMPNTSQIHRVGRAGKSHVGHMYLFQKDPDEWNILESGAWGKMRYTVEGPQFDFVFNGHGLEPGTDYTLIYYPDPWPGEGLVCLGQGIVNDGGNIHIMGSPETGSLPREQDENYDEGAKIWLALSDDVSCDPAGMVEENFEYYLFEYDLIEYAETDKMQGGMDFEGAGRSKGRTTAAQASPVIRSDLDIFIPEAWMFDQGMSFKLEYWENPDDEDGIYFKLDEKSFEMFE